MKFRKLRFGNRKRYAECFDRAAQPDATENRTSGCGRDPSQDKGNAPVVFNIASEFRRSDDRKRALWTGKHMQLIIERINERGSGEPIYNGTADMSMYVVCGHGDVRLGKQMSNMGESIRIGAGSQIMIPENSYYLITSDGGNDLDVVVHCSPRAYPFGFSEQKSRK